MLWSGVLVQLLLAVGLNQASAAEDCPNLVISAEWAEGIDAVISFELDHSTSGWEVHLTYDTALTSLDCFMGDVATTDNINFVITNLDWDSDYNEGDHVDLHIMPHFTTRPYLIAADIDGEDICGNGGTVTTTTKQPTTTTQQPETSEQPTQPPTTTPSSGDCDGVVDIGTDDGTQTDVSLSLTPTANLESWSVEITFSGNVVSVTSPLATVTGSGKKWTLSNKSFDGSLPAGDTFVLSFSVNHGGSGLPNFESIIFDNIEICGGESTPSPAGDCEDISDAINNGDDTDLTIHLTPETSLTSWEVELTFSDSVGGVSSPLADVTGSGTTWTLTSKSWDGSLPAGETFELTINIIHGNSGEPSLMDVKLNSESICEGGESTPSPGGDCEDMSDAIDNGDDTDMTIHLTPETSLTSWEVGLTFASAVGGVSSPLADVTGSGKTWTLTSKSWDGSLPAGETFELTINIIHGNSGTPVLADVKLNSESICEGGSGPGPVTTTPAVQTTTTEGSSYNPDHPSKYEYGEVIEKTLLFYEAQRSGPLPASQRVKWRGDSGMSDAVLGGYHDAGDHVKFGFPMAAFTTVLAWGGINFKSGYDKASQTDYLVECLKWSTDYFIGCHTSDNELVGQIGDGNADHSYWGRPEEMTMARPAFSITQQQPGSELAGETSAALAASSVFFRMAGYDSAYADECLDHAKTLYKFADEYRGVYTDAIPATGFYNDFGGYNDEIVWAAAWIAMATRDPADIAVAEEKYAEFNLGGSAPQEVSWDDKTGMIFLVMYELTGKNEYMQKAERFAEFILSADRTGKGLIWVPSSEWGSLRYAANFAMYATQLVHYDIMADDMFEFAESQINYILGDTGRSYVVGYGTNPPQKCHHRAASCGDLPAQCDWSNKDSAAPNPQVSIQKMSQVKVNHHYDLCVLFYIIGGVVLFKTYHSPCNILLIIYKI